MVNVVSILFSVSAALVAFGAYIHVTSGWARAKRSDVARSAAPGPGEPIEPQAHRASDFPEDWWVGETLFELERRAIFSKHWIYLTHRSHFSKPGDYHTFQLANFPIFLILGKDHVIRAFHNVCRHRAYTITKKKSGSSTVLGCRYHGWSYDTRGRLIKAPAFDEIESFDKSQNGLFEIHTHTTRQGFVFANLSAEKVTTPEVRMVDILAKSWGISERSAPLAQLDFAENVNWKQAVHYMEKTGCSTTVPPNAWLDLASKMPFLSNIGGQSAHSVLDHHGLSSLHISADGRLWYTVSASPTSATHTLFTCHVYLNWPGDNAQADIAIEAIKDEVQSLLSGAKAEQPALDAVATRLQLGILDGLTAHLKEERKRGKEVWPASRESNVSERYNQADLLCKQLSCPKPQTAPDMGLWGKIGPVNELEW